MAIVLCIDEIMDAKGISVSELAREVGISRANMSNLKFGHVKAIRFSTLDRICDVLDCQPGEIIKFEKSEPEAPRLQDGSALDLAFAPQGGTGGDLPAASEVPISMLVPDAQSSVRLCGEHFEKRG